MTSPDLLPRQVVFSYFCYALIFMVGLVRMVVLTRHLPVAEFGVYALIAVLLRTLPRILSLASLEFLGTTLPRAAMDRQRALVHSLLTVGAALGAGLVLIAVFVTSTGMLSFFRLDGQGASVIVGSVLAAILLWITILRAYLYGLQKIRTYNTLALAAESIWVVLLIPIALATRLSVLTVMGVWLVGDVCVLLVGFRASGISWVDLVPLRLDWSLVREWVAFGVPLLPFAGGVGLVWALDRFFLAQYRTLVEVGYYTVAFNLCVMLLTVGVVMTSGVYPHLICPAPSGRAGR